MPRRPSQRSRDQGRIPLSRERVLAGAIAVADAAGIGSLTMRSLAQHLDVKPMALYHYVANKSEIIDGIVDLVYGEIELPSADGDWRAGMVLRAHSAREVLRRHPWAIALCSPEPPRAPRPFDTTTRSSAPCVGPVSR